MYGSNYPEVPKSRIQILTEQFYAWEKRGRGWQIWHYPVQLEPNYIPFYGHYVPSDSSEFFDDARKPTLLSSLADKITGYFKSSPRQEVQIEEMQPELVDEAFPDIYVPDDDIVEFQLSIPHEYQTRMDVMEQFIRALNYVSFPISFELIGNKEKIIVQFCCRLDDAQHLRELLHAYIPEAHIHQTAEYLMNNWDDSGKLESVVIDFGLANECMLPINSFARFDIDPMIGLVAAMEDLAGDEVGVFQVLFQPVINSWPKSMLNAVTGYDGKSFFVDAPEMVTLTKQKISKPLFSAVIRVATQSDIPERTWNTAKRLAGALTQFDQHGSNRFIPLENDGYPDEIHELDLVHRRSHRTGQFLNSEELVSIAHLPSASVRSAKLYREIYRTKAAPEITFGHGMCLGTNFHRQEDSTVTLSTDQRMKHMYMIGASGTGKSTLLGNMILQDTEAGEGLAVLDPHGDLIDEILGRIPEERFGDVIIFDPSDSEYPVGFNILDAHSELEKNLIASDLTGIFKRLSTSWGDQMNSVLSNAILAFLEHKEVGTLMHMRRFLVDKDYRKQILKGVTDPEIVFYWEKEFPLLSGKPQGPILTRLDMFLRPKLIRNMVAQKNNRINFSEVMNGQKIFLAKLSHGAIGEENSFLMGAFLVSKFQQTAMSRQELEKSRRKEFYLYIDEFQNFTTPSMESLLSGGRKYGIGLILAHQGMQQLVSRNADVASSVITNPYSRICFRMGDADAKKLESGFSYFSAQDLQNLGVGEAICRVEQAAYDFNLETVPLPQIDQGEAEMKRTRLIDLSRKMYGASRQKIEEMLALEMRETFGKKEITEEKEPSFVPEKPVPNVAEKEIPKKPRENKVVEGSISDDIPLMGRGGPQHKYLQNLIKKIAEEKGYQSTIEYPIDSGAGQVDVALIREDKKIACEISITTSVDHELNNVQKCIAAGFDSVILLTSEARHLRKLKSHIEPNLSETEQQKVRFFLPDDFVGFLDQEAASGSSKENVVKGYKVKVNFKSVSEQEQELRQESIAKIILQSMKRMEKTEKKK